MWLGHESTCVAGLTWEVEIPEVRMVGGKGHEDTIGCVMLVVCTCYIVCKDAAGSLRVKDQVKLEFAVTKHLPCCLSFVSLYTCSSLAHFKTWPLRLRWRWSPLAYRGCAAVVLLGGC